MTNLDDKHFAAYLAWGRLLCDRGESSGHVPAADLLRQAIRLCGQSAEAHFFLARACLASYRRERAAKVPQLGETPADTDLDEAIAHFREAARLDAEMTDKTALELAEAHRLKAQAQATRRQWNQAIATMTVALEYEPDEPRNYILRAMYRASGGNADEARKDYEQAFRQGFIPPPVETWQGIANGLMLSNVQEDIRENQWRAARDKTRDLEKVARGMSADISNLHAGIARGYLVAKNVPVAIAHCNAALGWDAANAEAYWVRGLAIAVRDKPVLWEDQQGEEGDENERWLFPGWPKKTEMPDDWMPNSGKVAREIAWGIAWEKKWTEAWNIAWQADLEKAAKLAPRYENELERMRNSEGRE